MACLKAEAPIRKPSGLFLMVRGRELEADLAPLAQGRCAINGILPGFVGPLPFNARSLDTSLSLECEGNELLRSARAALVPRRKDKGTKTSDAWAVNRSPSALVFAAKHAAQWQRKARQQVGP